MPTWRSDASAPHTPSRQSLLDEKSVSSRSGTFWFSSSAHLVVDSSGSLPLLSLPHSAVRNFCTDAKKTSVGCYERPGDNFDRGLSIRPGYYVSTCHAGFSHQSNTRANRHNYTYKGGSFAPDDRYDPVALAPVVGHYPYA